MSDSTAQSIRQLKIKTGVVKRLFKEEQVYKKEAQDQAVILDRLKSEGADGADVRNAERVLKDSEQMIPRTRKQLEEGFQALEDLVNALHSEDSIKDTSEFQDAFSQLQQVEAAWKSDGN